MMVDRSFSRVAIGHRVFWKKKTTPDDDLLEGSGEGADRNAPTSGVAQFADAALDTVVAMLRTLGRYAFDVGGIDTLAFRRQSEAWAEHLAVGAPHPERPA